LVKSGAKTEPWVAVIEDIYYDASSQLKVDVRWLLRADDVNDGVKQYLAQASFSSVLPVRCVNGRCALFPVLQTEVEVTHGRIVWVSIYMDAFAIATTRSLSLTGVYLSILNLDPSSDLDSLFPLVYLPKEGAALHEAFAPIVADLLLHSHHSTLDDSLQQSSVVAALRLAFIEGDRNMQDEMAGHRGANALKFCRACDTDVREARSGNVNVQEFRLRQTQLRVLYHMAEQCIYLRFAIVIFSKGGHGGGRPIITRMCDADIRHSSVRCCST